MKILGIESSCDETAAAVVEDGRRVLSNVVVSQIDIHSIYGGVIPEIAARSHIEAINPVINKALADANTNWGAIDAIGVTYAPGLIGSLLIGTLAARTLAIVKQKPLYAIHHVEAHVYANFLLPLPEPTFPLLALIVSGGHTQLVLFEDHGQFRILGHTQDDAVGEAFDKVAKILGLPYPGGPSIALAAQQGNPDAYTLPKARLQGKYDFSFSGLKTAVLRAVQREVGKDITFPSHELSGLLTSKQRHDFAASFQKTAIETLVDTTVKAFIEYSPASVVIAGGVAANEVLRCQLTERLPLPIHYAHMQFCTDNAAMIASLAYFRAQKNKPADPYELDVIPHVAMST